MNDVRHDLIRRRPKPSVIDLDTPPPGVIKNLLAPDLVAYRLQRFGRIPPRLTLVHTNGGPNPSSLDGIRNWANQWNDNSKPHFQVQRDGSAWMLLPLYVKGICNYRADMFSNAIETQDLGWPTPDYPDRPGGTVGYTPEQADTIGAILAYIHLATDGAMPLDVPTAWDGSGVGSHTDPFGTGYWTKYIKPCPGDAKKAQLRTLLIPTAQAYVAYWQGDDMTAIDPFRWFDTRQAPLGNPMRAGQTITVPLPPVLQGATQLFLNVTVVPITTKPGFVSVWADGPRPTVSNVNFRTTAIANSALVKVGDDGKIRFFANQETHLIVDVQGR